MVTDIRAGAPPDGRTLLADILGLPALRGARVVPPRAALDRPISALVVADSDAPDEIDALVVSAGGPPDELPRRLRGRRLPRPPTADIGRAGDRAPLGRTLGRGASPRWQPAIAGGTGRAGADRARTALRAPLMEGRGYPGLAATASELLGAPVAILDDYLDLRGSAGLSDEQEAFLDAAVVRARGHGPASVVGPFVEEAMPGIIREVVHGPRASSGCSSPGSLRRSRPPSRGCSSELAEASAMERAREEVRTETESRLRGDLIEELMAGEVVSRESLVRRARHLGADLSGGAVALIGKLQDPHTEGRVITDPRLVRRFLQQARAAMDIHWPRALVDWNEGRLLALLPPDALRRRRAEPRGDRGAGLHARQAPAGRDARDRPRSGPHPRPLALHARARAPRRRARRGAPGAVHRRAPGQGRRGGDLRGDRHLQAALPDLRRPARRS